MMIFGAAWQRGLIPLSHAAIAEAIRLNGAAVDANLRAFEVGRWAALYPAEVEKLLTPKVIAKPKTLAERIAYREAHLSVYQGKRLVRRYRRLLDGITDEGVKDAVAQGYHKLLAYKDEYEVARLHLETADKARAEFGGDFTLKFHLAPPMLSKMGSDGRPKKREFGPGILRAFGMLARLKVLRGTPLDPFGRTAERKMERALIKEYERDMTEVLPMLNARTRDAIIALALLPLSIRGFGPVKEGNAAKAATRRTELLAVIRSGGAEMAQAAE
jgi:indolepyruvate ferredoxin oxidoreductase